MIPRFEIPFRKDRNGYGGGSRETSIIEGFSGLESIFVERTRHCAWTPGNWSMK